MKKTFVIFIISIMGTASFAQEKKEVIPNKNDETVSMVVEDPAKFPGGEDARLKFLANNIIYPKEAREKGIQGTVYVTFVVEPNGSLTNIKILRGIGGGCDEEVIRLVSIMPKFEPGKQKGQSVRVQYNMAVRFILEKDDDKKSKKSKKK